MTFLCLPPDTPLHSRIKLISIEKYTSEASEVGIPLLLAPPRPPAVLSWNELLQVVAVCVKEVILFAYGLLLAWDPFAPSSSASPDSGPFLAIYVSVYVSVSEDSGHGRLGYVCGSTSCGSEDAPLPPMQRVDPEKGQEDASSDQVERGAMAARAVYHGARVHVGTMLLSKSRPPGSSSTLRQRFHYLNARSNLLQFRPEALQLPGYTIGAFVR
ncbi:hypothetical protein KC323_g188 [Hortaea werneckii]|nr:hypothetical protein KC323_g188 [Hortaea werneckii]